jgi:hypothetical protein
MSTGPTSFQISPDWIEDASHENGHYQNLCMSCGSLFLAHKRRPFCRDCSTPNSIKEQLTAQQAALKLAEYALAQIATYGLPFEEAGIGASKLKAIAHSALAAIRAVKK